jgi:hypothetical protein
MDSAAAALDSAADLWIPPLNPSASHQKPWVSLWKPWIRRRNPGIQQLVTSPPGDKSLGYKSGAS